MVDGVLRFSSHVERQCVKTGYYLYGSRYQNDRLLRRVAPSAVFCCCEITAFRGLRIIIIIIIIIIILS